MMTTFTSTFTFGTDENGTEGLIPEFLHGVPDHLLTAHAARLESVAHDIIEHGRAAHEGDVRTELAAIGAYVVGRWGFEATYGNPASALAQDVEDIIESGATCGPRLPHTGPIEEWVRTGVRDGIKSAISNLDPQDDDERGIAADLIRDRRRMESAVQHGAERCLAVYGSSDFAYEAFCNAKDAAEEAMREELYAGASVTFTTDTDTRETSWAVQYECFGCGDMVDVDVTCCTEEE